MDESVSQMMQEQLQRAENDLTLACLQEIESVPTRKEIIERLPPLGKAALAYDPTRDDFFDLLDKYAVPMTDEEYIEFANGLFFDTFGIRYIAYEEKTGMKFLQSLLVAGMNYSDSKVALFYNY